MPKIRRKDLPRNVLIHLLDRIENRSVSTEQLQLLADWLDSAPDVPEGKWFKRFPAMTACGEGEFVLTFLTAAQTPSGEEVV